jgi:diguanylate cyclase (GGDEF)-like protein
MLLRARLEEAVSSPQAALSRLAVMVLDLDGFKEVNDRFGHTVGDALLVQVAQRWKALLREGDTLARLGGNEFALLLPTNGAVSRATTVAERLVQAVGRPFVADGTMLQTGVSIGIAIATSSSNRDVLLREADFAIYRAKRNGGGWALHAPELDQIAVGTRPPASPAQPRDIQLAHLPATDQGPITDSQAV